MNKLLQFCAVVALSLGLAAPVAATQFGPNKYSSDVKALEQEAWDLACSYTGVDCAWVPRPLIWYLNIPTGAYGRYYFGTNSIIVNQSLYRETFSGMVMMHEMVHYLQDRFRPAPMFLSQICQMEAEAFNTTYAAAARLKYWDDRLAVWPQIRHAYFGC